MSDQTTIQGGPDYQLRASFVDGEGWELVDVAGLLRSPVVQFQVIRPGKIPEAVTVNMEDGGVQFCCDPVFFADTSHLKNRRPIFAEMDNGSLLIGWQGNDADGHNHKLTFQLQ